MSPDGKSKLLFVLVFLGFVAVATYSGIGLSVGVWIFIGIVALGLWEWFWEHTENRLPPPASPKSESAQEPFLLPEIPTHKSMFIR